MHIESSHAPEQDTNEGLVLSANSFFTRVQAGDRTMAIDNKYLPADVLDKNSRASVGTILPADTMQYVQQRHAAIKRALDGYGIDETVTPVQSVGAGE